MADKFIDVAADAMLFHREGGQLDILLVKRKFDPYAGMWAFPGGFVNYDEDPHDAAIRELHEETGVQLTHMKQLRTFGKPGRDPRGHTVSIVHYAFVDAHEHSVAADDDAAEAKWVNVREIKELAFDHMEILEFAMHQLELGPFRFKGGVE